MSRAKRSPERLRLRWWDSPPLNCRDGAASRLEVGDPPDYSMFQESAPRTLVIGEEHFTFLGYHSNRWCQGPREILSAVNREASQDSCPVVTVSPSRCPRTTQQRMEEQPEFLCTVTAKNLLEGDFSWRRESSKSLTDGHPSRNPDAIYRLASPVAECRIPARSSTRRGMSSARPSLERLAPCWRASPPSNGRVDDASPLGVGDLPDYSMFQESAPRTLVIGEEHFTFLGYHSERRCQAPCGFHRP